MDGSESTIRVICGPTAAGKTAAALWFARRADVVVVSADSRQVYRGFDVGTAKPSPEEQSVAPHLGIDVLDPTERASAAWWADRGDAWLRQTISRGITPVVVGGTGLYLRALFGTLFHEPPIDPDRRAALRDELATLPAETLRRWVGELDPARATFGRTQLLRAAEIALLTGRRVSDLHREQARAPRWRARYLVVDPGAALAARIEARVHQMIGGGWPEEVRALIGTVPSDAPAWNASGYRAIRAMVQGELGARAATERVIVETRQYAKRQRTWFRHQLSGARVAHADVGSAGWDAVAESWWNEESA